MSLPGVDVSSFQGAPGSWTAAAGPISWAAVKLSELSAQGQYVNPDAAADWEWLKANGKGRVAYLFGHPGVGVAATVALFETELRALGLEDSDGIALDLEVTDGRTPAQVAEWALAVLKQLGTALDRGPLCYTFRDFAAAGNCAGLGDYLLWLADPSHPAGQAAVPAPWKACVIQQTKITGAIDRDVAFWPDLKAMQAALGKRKPPAPAKVVHWRTKGFWSLNKEAKKHNTTPAEMIRLANEAKWHYKPAMAKYILRADWDARVPVRTMLFAPAT